MWGQGPGRGSRVEETVLPPTPSLYLFLSSIAPISLPFSLALPLSLSVPLSGTTGILLHPPSWTEAAPGHE
jgi:hypothetical protein